MPISWREETVEADVLVVGGGIAACCAAVEAAKFGVRVILADKGRLGVSGSTPTSGGGVAFPDPGQGDDVAKFYEDTWRAGDELGDPALVRILCEEAGEGVQRLEQLGIPFEHGADGGFTHRSSLGHRSPRSCSPLGRGAGMMVGLRKEVFHRGVTVYENLAVTRVIVSGGEVRGAYGIDLRTGSARLFKVPSVILGAGGATDLYPVASANYLTSGDSYALAYEAGAMLANMEFVEFTIVPASAGGRAISSGGATSYPGQGGRLYNSLGERFMERYDPEKLERARRSNLVRAIYTECIEGRGPIMMDASWIPPERRHILERSESILKLRASGIEPWQDRFEWVITVHTFLGGAVIDEEGRTTVPGLYAAGEASNGIHGADRLSGNAIGEGIVFGFRAGRAAAKRALAGLVDGRAADGRGLDGRGLDGHRDRLRMLLAASPSDTRELKRSLQQAAWSRIGVRRSGEGLREAESAFEELGSAALGSGARDLKEAQALMELANLSLTGKLIARAALRREESRGQHWRTEHPQKDGAWNRWIVQSRERGEEVTTPAELAAAR
ncbi:MAG: FAD-dependent oxidoreductase [Firmicutes bacterium]|nr:FAD-dependent oxidoreductase [Bacillota bacterium]